MKAKVETCKIKHAVQGNTLTRVTPRSSLAGKTSCIAHLVVTINLEGKEDWIDEQRLKEITQKALNIELDPSLQRSLHRLEQVEKCLARERRSYRDLQAHFATGRDLLQIADDRLRIAKEEIDGFKSQRDSALVERNIAREEVNRMRGIHEVKDAPSERFAMLEHDEERVREYQEAYEARMQEEREKEAAAARERQELRDRRKRSYESRRAQNGASERGGMLELDD